MLERGIFMFKNDLLSDVGPVVRSSSDDSDAKKSKMAILAHKFVWSICSPVFLAMFNGAVSETSDYLPYCEYEGVLKMLRYMYSGEVELKESNVMQVLYVAKKYILPSLAEECIDILIRNLDVGNGLSLLSHAEQSDNEKCLVDRCWELIDRETEEAVKSTSTSTFTHGKGCPSRHGVLVLVYILNTLLKKQCCVIQYFVYTRAEETYINIIRGT